jgi:hypothetical protein
MRGIAFDLDELGEPTPESKAIANEVALRLLDFMVDTLTKVDEMHSPEEISGKDGSTIFARAMIEASFWQGDFKPSLVELFKGIIVIYNLDREQFLSKVEELMKYDATRTAKEA